MSSEFTPRLCHLVKWAGCDSFGFYLDAENSTCSDQFIGEVLKDSPARLAGLRIGDRIVEVNGVNIARENHLQVVERIKSIAGEARLLVVDPAADRFYRKQNVVVKSTMPDVLHLKTLVPWPCKEPPPCCDYVAPEGSPVEKNGTQECTEQYYELTAYGTYEQTVANEVEDSPQIIKGKNSHVHETKANNGKQNDLPSNETQEKTIGKEVEEILKGKDSPVQKTKDIHSSTPLDDDPSSVPDSPRCTIIMHKRGRSWACKSTNQPIPRSTKSSSNIGSFSLEECILNLNMSAFEMRQTLLAKRPKKDLKKEQMDFRQKYEIFQRM